MEDQAAETSEFIPRRKPLFLLSHKNTLVLSSSLNLR